MPDGETTSEGGTVSNIIELPIIPVSTVLFPGGVLPLRVVETRHIDMVRYGIKNHGLFGVCLFNDNSEKQNHSDIGCTARVVDFDNDGYGALILRTVGEQRFRPLTHYIHPDGWVMSTAELIVPEPSNSVPPELLSCTDLIRRLVSELELKERDPMRRMIAEPYQFDAMTWVSNRLSEFLPIPSSIRQKLMALDDAYTRLSLIHHYLEQHGLLSRSNSN